MGPKRKLAIISDLWGIRQSDWLTCYTDALQSSFDITYFDACELGDINLDDYSQSYLHQQFVSGGIRLAAANLFKTVKSCDIIIGCSIGGSIAWQAGILGLPFNTLITISATRLRHETTKPTGEVYTFFGELDEYKPGEKWFQLIEVDRQIIPNIGHNLYASKVHLESIFKTIFHTN